MNNNNGDITKTFNGVNIGVAVKGGATGSETVSVTGVASTTFGGKEFNVGLRDVKYK